MAKDIKKSSADTPAATTKKKSEAPVVRDEAVLGPKGYFKGSWYELRQVQWPNRKATWSLTLAVILFTLFFAVFILALDAGFQYLSNKVLL